MRLTNSGVALTESDSFSYEAYVSFTASDRGGGAEVMGLSHTPNL